MRIGKVISIEYDKFRVRLFASIRNSTILLNGRVYYFGNIGSYLKVSNSIGDKILCEVAAIADYGKESKMFSSFDLDSDREFIIKPIGTIKVRGGFAMGIGLYPCLYSDVEIVTDNDLRGILTAEQDDSEIHKTIDVGYSKSLINYKISLSIDRLFGIHTAVLGNSGSGKSNTIARILQEVLRKETNYARGAKFILFDSNGEYSMAFDGGLNENIGSMFYRPNLKDNVQQKFSRFNLPYYLLNLDEWLGFLMASERTQKPFWDKVLQQCYKFYKVFEAGDNDGKEAQKYSNYIKWKTWKILTQINGRAESDTAKMTAAKGAIQGIRSIYKDVAGQIEEGISKDLGAFYDICNKLCSVSYGNNNGALATALPLFVKEKGNSQYVVCSQDKAQGKSEVTVNLSKKSEGQCFEQLDETSAQDVDDEKLPVGCYYNYKFLRAAVELVMLEEEAKGNYRIREYMSTLITRLEAFLTHDDCDFMREGTKCYEGADDYLQKVFGIGEYATQLIIVDSSEIGTDSLELMTSVISRMLLDYRKRRSDEERRKSPVHLILDEAHRYIHKDAHYILSDNIFERIAREGRKYALYLLISSQRPSELSQTVLSQCGNYIIHRIQNEQDLKYVYAVLPYFSDDYTNRIKQALPGEALVFGNCVPMPLHVEFKQAEPDPNSRNCCVSEEWFRQGIKE